MSLIKRLFFHNADLVEWFFIIMAIFFVATCSYWIGRLEEREARIHAEMSAAPSDYEKEATAAEAAFNAAYNAGEKR